MKRVILGVLSMLLFGLPCLPASATLLTEDFNDGVIDDDKWNTFGPGMVDERNGSLNFDWSDPHNARGISSNFWLGGDFDVQIDFKNWGLTPNLNSSNPNPLSIGLEVQNAFAPRLDSVNISRAWFPDNIFNGDFYESSRVSNGVFLPSEFDSTAALSGRLGITRTITESRGATVSTYYFDPAGAQHILSTTESAFTTPAKISLFSWTEDSASTFHAEFDNLKAFSEVFLFPEGDPPTDGSYSPPTSQLLAFNALANVFSPAVNDYIDSTKSTVLLTHGWNPIGEVDLNTTPWWELATAIHDNTGADYNILGWNWPDEADVVDPFTTLPTSAFNEAYQLTKALKDHDLLASISEQQDLHLIGHSVGSVVINKSAEIMTRSYHRVPTQLTFLDAWSGLGYGLNAGGVSLWADNYRSSLEGASRIPGTYNVDLRPLPDEAEIDPHGYAIAWYTATAVEPSEQKGGFYWSKEAGGWYDPDRPLRSSTIHRPPPIEKRRDDFLAWEWERKNTVYKQGDYAILKVASDAFLFREYTFPEDFDFLSFDFNFFNLGDGDYLTLSFNDDPLFFFEGQNFLGEEFINSDLIDVQRFAGQHGYLTFALKGVGDLNDAEVALTNLRFYELGEESGGVVPEPSTLLLTLFSVPFLPWTRNRRSRGRFPPSS